MTSVFIERTFQLCKGVGPYRERDLWARGIETWSELETRAASAIVMSSSLDSQALTSIKRARQALQENDLETLATLIPARDHWRLYARFANEAAFFDIEADGAHVPTVVGVMDRWGLASFRRGHSLARLSERLAQSRVWVTFNGAVFDVPSLEKTFDSFPKPVVHIDLRFLVRRVGLKGGLKGIEEALNLHRPPHLKGVRGFDAISLWRAWNDERRLESLRLLTEYNLYDAINLRSVLEWCQWRVAERLAWNVERGTVFDRGDVLYDLSKLLLALPT
jgi:hypothetical protein